MPHPEALIPRPILFNAVLYGFSALVYSATLFTLEYLRPGKYIFDPESSWRSRFSYLSICSWPIILFGALTLIAVRIGARSRRIPSKKDRAKRKAKKLAAAAAAAADPNHPIQNPTYDPKRPQQSYNPSQLPKLPSSPDQPPPSQPASQSRQQPVKKQSSGQQPVKKQSSGQQPVNKQSSGKRRKKKLNRVPRGYLSVTRAQRLFASFAFVWVAIGLACTAACATLVFFGQRERYRYNANVLGIDESKWKTWVIPLVTGGVPALVYAVMSLMTLVQSYSTIIARERSVKTPNVSEGNHDLDVELGDPGATDGRYDVEVVFEQTDPYSAVPQPVGMVARGGIEDYDENADAFALSPRGETKLPLQPDQKTVDRMMRQLRDMGFKNAHQNIAALQASSFDLELAREKLANSRL